MPVSGLVNVLGSAPSIKKFFRSLWKIVAVKEPTGAKYHSKEASHWVDSIGFNAGLPPLPFQTTGPTDTIFEPESTGPGNAGAFGSGSSRVIFKPRAPRTA